MPIIDWRTYAAGSLAAISVLVALHVMSAPVVGMDWYRVISQAVISGPFWAQLTLVFWALKYKKDIFSFSSERALWALVFGFVMPLGVINDTPVPWVVFFVREFFIPEFSHEIILAFGVFWFLVWQLLLGPVFELKTRFERLLRSIVVSISLAYGAVPSLTLLFQQVGVA